MASTRSPRGTRPAPAAGRSKAAGRSTHPGRESPGFAGTNALRLVPGGVDEALDDALSAPVSGEAVSDERAGIPLDERLSPSERAIVELEELDDVALVALARVQDRRAFEVLYRRHVGFVMNLAVRIQGNSVDVEDIAHDAFLRAHDRLEALRDGSVFRSWVAAIAVSLVRTRLRRRKFFGVFGLSASDGVDLDALVSDDSGPEVRAQVAEVYARLSTLPIDDQIAWTLRYVQQHTLPDVATIVDCSLATVKRRIARARDHLGDFGLSTGDVDEPEARDDREEGS